MPLSVWQRFSAWYSVLLLLLTVVVHVPAAPAPASFSKPSPSLSAVMQDLYLLGCAPLPINSCIRACCSGVRRASTESGIGGAPLMSPVAVTSQSPGATSMLGLAALSAQAAPARSAAALAARRLFIISPGGQDPAGQCIPPPSAQQPHGRRAPAASFRRCWRAGASARARTRRYRSTRRS